MKKTVSAYDARTRFGEMINLAYYQGMEIIVEKMGKPMVKITKVTADEVKPNRAELIEKYAGIWRDEDLTIVKKEMKKFRKNFKLIREHVSV
jgi:antitoxin (DNA-binding transcriptional repressor) of toxin-antitoxin stability system